MSGLDEAFRRFLDLVDALMTEAGRWRLFLDWANKQGLSTDTYDGLVPPSLLGPAEEMRQLLRGFELSAEQSVYSAAIAVDFAVGQLAGLATDVSGRRGRGDAREEALWLERTEAVMEPRREFVKAVRSKAIEGPPPSPESAD